MTMSSGGMNKDEIRKGIAAYKHEQNVLLRLIRKTGGLTEGKFDELFYGREFRKRTRLRRSGLYGDSYILGMGSNGGTLWAEYLDLLQYMMAVDLVDTKRNNDNEIVYIECKVKT